MKWTSFEPWHQVFHHCLQDCSHHHVCLSLVLKNSPKSCHQTASLVFSLSCFMLRMLSFTVTVLLYISEISRASSLCWDHCPFVLCAWGCVCWPGLSFWCSCQKPTESSSRFMSSVHIVAVSIIFEFLPALSQIFICAVTGVTQRPGQVRSYRWNSWSRWVRFGLGQQLCENGVWFCVGFPLTVVCDVDLTVCTPRVPKW